MTERKPPDISFRTWVDQQIDAATERGAFDNLPGAGRPLPRRAGADDGQSWIRDYVRREGVPVDELLPLPLRLLREREHLAQSAPALASEAAARTAVAELNERIMKWRQLPIGPPVFVPLVDEDLIVSRWRAAQPSAPPPEQDGPAPARPGGSRWRWWLRRRSAV
jgi:Domain of unknown function (DUF1992)